LNCKALIKVNQGNAIPAFYSQIFQIFLNKIQEMRKLMLMIMALAFMSSYVIAQGNANDTRSKFQLGLKAGTNYANVYDTQGEEFRADGKFGFVGGASSPFHSAPCSAFNQKCFFPKKDLRQLAHC
jgi:hypothetical protein